MTSRSRRIRSLELCNADVFGQIVVTKQTLPLRNPRVRSAVWAQLKPPPIHPDDDPKEYEKRRASVLLDQLLLEIYSNLPTGCSDYNSATSSKSQRASYKDVAHLKGQGTEELRASIGGLEGHVVRIGSILVRQLKRRDALRRQRDARYDVISYLLRKRVPEFSPEMRFSIEPLPGDSGFSQWHSAMKMVSQLPEGIPPEFRRRLWLSLAEKHLSSKGIDWSRVERNCFSEWSHPADAELGVQIVKDLHRTGCSLFCGKDGQENQALLKRVLLAYARWNKAVGYCQGFNMLAALILQVTEKCETDALKLMIYLIEGVLPDSYFADSLRGLSVDMAVFRELLRTKLPRLSRHLDTLQVASKEGTTSYEPPLTNVFTMQWFLTLFCNCLPQPTVLRVWDLILLEGNEILLRTALAIWQVLADKIMTAKSADEFYCVMGMLMREILEFDLIDANTLIKGIVTIGPLTELHNLREHYLYNINPWGGSIPAGDSDRRMKVYHKDRLVLDIGVLKKQYTKLKQRQRQAHIIFNTAVARQTARPTPVAMNHLLLGKSALVPAKRLGPPKGAIPPARQPVNIPPPQPPKTLHWKDTRRDSSSSSTSSSDTELCDEPDAEASSDDDDSKCQLPDDNLTEPSDKTLMIEDNTKQTSASASEDLVDLEAKPDLDNQIEIKSDIFDNSETSSSDLYDLNVLQRSDSVASEDGFDFEKFLEERVKSFKEKTFSSEESIEDTSEQERLRYARRNSVRALEIIQENSLILHRILQCQARMTPTPPPTDPEDQNAPNLDLDLIPRDDDDATPTNEFTAGRDLIDCAQIESSLVSRSASLEGIISKYSTISKESDNRSSIGSDESIEEVDYHLEKYRQKLGSPITEENNSLLSEETKNKESCEKINKYIQNAISKNNYNQIDLNISEGISKDNRTNKNNLSKDLLTSSSNFRTDSINTVNLENTSTILQNIDDDDDDDKKPEESIDVKTSTNNEKQIIVSAESSLDLNTSSTILKENPIIKGDNLQNFINTNTSTREDGNLEVEATNKKRDEDSPSLITKEEYENFRAKILEETYLPNKTIKSSKCEDPEDLEDVFLLNKTIQLSKSENQEDFLNKTIQLSKNEDRKDFEETYLLNKTIQLSKSENQEDFLNKTIQLSKNEDRDDLEETYLLNKTIKLSKNEDRKDLEETYLLNKTIQVSKNEDQNDSKQLKNNTVDKQECENLRSKTYTANKSKNEEQDQHGAKIFEETYAPIKNIQNEVQKDSTQTKREAINKHEDGSKISIENITSINKDFAILQQSVHELNRSLNYRDDDYPSYPSINQNIDEGKSGEDYLQLSSNTDSGDFYKSYQSAESVDRSSLNLDSLVKYNFDDDYENEVFMDKLESPKSLKDFSECRRPSLPVVEEELEDCVKVNDESIKSTSKKIGEGNESIKSVSDKIGEGNDVKTLKSEDQIINKPTEVFVGIDSTVQIIGEVTEEGQKLFDKNFKGFDGLENLESLINKSLTSSDDTNVITNTSNESIKATNVDDEERKENEKTVKPNYYNYTTNYENESKSSQINVIAKTNELIKVSNIQKPIDDENNEKLEANKDNITSNYYNYSTNYENEKSLTDESKSSRSEKISTYNFEFLDELCRKQIAKINEAACGVVITKAGESKTIKDDDSSYNTSSPVGDSKNAKNYEGEEQNDYSKNIKTCYNFSFDKSREDFKDLEEVKESVDYSKKIKTCYNLSPTEKQNKSIVEVQDVEDCKDEKSNDYSKNVKTYYNLSPTETNKTIHSTSPSKYKYEIESPDESYKTSSPLKCRYQTTSPQEHADSSTNSSLSTKSLLKEESSFKPRDDNLETSGEILTTTIESTIGTYLSDVQDEKITKPNLSPSKQHHSPTGNNKKYKQPPSTGEEAMIEIAKTSKYTSILEYSRNLDERFNNLILKAPGPNLNYSYSLDSEDTPSSSSNLLRSPSVEGQSSPRSPNRSPSHAYNPFPVNISSRQNKEVAVRLGLYKKS